MVGAGNDYQKDMQFRKLNAQKDIIEVTVTRGAETKVIKNTELVVGDVYLINMGDKVVADGIMLDGYHLVIDEASLTGESDPIKKYPEEDPWVRSGTQVSEGSGRLLVVAVGQQSEWGKTMALVGGAGSEDTPLQEKLADLAAAIGKIGFGVAVACFIALLIKWCVVNRGFPVSKINQNGPVQFFLYAVTIVVVAVPEGLPLAVTIALAYSMKKMMKVRIPCRPAIARYPGNSRHLTAGQSIAVCRQDSSKWGSHVCRTLALLEWSPRQSLLLQRIMGICSRSDGNACPFCWVGCCCYTRFYMLAGCLGNWNGGTPLLNFCQHAQSVHVFLAGQ
eukprot:GHRR01015184.1.p1 GENE.GHRR01015184.1~~GHRR01015184.1.p1  ORF type:complete len:334 (+),score=87.06 GHRR01015184.1:1208-2209(+)